MGIFLLFIRGCYGYGVFEFWIVVFGYGYGVLMIVGRVEVVFICWWVLREIFVIWSLWGCFCCCDKWELNVFVEEWIEWSEVFRIFIRLKGIIDFCFYF